MAQIQLNDAISQILAVLREAFEGPAESWSYFTDHGSEVSYLGMLPKISAAEASISQGGSTIAAHVHHVVFALNESAGFIRGDRSPRDWKESWRMEAVDDREWSALLDRLHREYSDLQNAIESNASDSVESIGGTAGVLAHAAYHLGAIRQKVWFLRNNA